MGAKSERIRVDIDLDVPKPNSSEAMRKSLGIDQDQVVKQMHQSEESTVEAVCPRENAVGSQNSVNFRQEPVLQLRRRDVVEHREANGPIKGLILQRHRRGISTNDLYILVPHATLETLGQSAVDLNAGELLHGFLQDFRRGSISRADLENVVADIQTLESPGQGIALDGRLPSRRRAKRAMKKVHLRTSVCSGPLSLLLSGSLFQSTKLMKTTIFNGLRPSRCVMPLIMREILWCRKEAVTPYYSVDAT